MNKEINVVVTGAAGQIGYALLPRLVNGEAFGADTRVNLRCVELPAAIERLQGTLMELEDCALPQTGSLKGYSDFGEAVVDADCILLVGSVPRGITINGKKIEERADLLDINGGIFSEQGRLIGERAKADAKILVVGNPANTNCLIGQHHAKAPKQTWLAMMALDANRAKWQVAQKACVSIDQVENLVVWGNHSPTMVPDVDNSYISSNADVSVRDQIADENWLNGDFLTTVQQRGKSIIDARGASSAASAANAAVMTMAAATRPTPANSCFCAAINSTLVRAAGYDVPEGVIYGAPLRTKADLTIEVIPGFSMTEQLQSHMRTTSDELEQERDMVKRLL